MQKCVYASALLRRSAFALLRRYTSKLKKMKKISNKPINSDLPSKVSLSKNKKDITKLEKEVKKIASLKVWKS